MNELELEINAINSVLEKLRYEAQYAFKHACDRCGEMYKENNICDECRVKDKELIEVRIPKWERKLEIAMQKMK